MTCKICDWVCHRLGCFNIRTGSEATREEKLDAGTRRLDEVLGSLETNANRLEHAVTDINIQKHALEAFAKDITK